MESWVDVGEGFSKVGTEYKRSKRSTYTYQYCVTKITNWENSTVKHVSDWKRGMIMQKHESTV